MRSSHLAFAAASLVLLLGGCTTTGGYLELRGDPSIVRALSGALGDGMIIACSGQSATVTAESRSEFTYDSERPRTQARENFQTRRDTTCGGK